MCDRNERGSRRAAVLRGGARAPIDVQEALQFAVSDHEAAVLMRFQSGDQTRFVAVAVG